MNRLLVITGPTASGKSRLAMSLAESLPLEIISADSMQVYRHMDIGTDKPAHQDLQKVRHHLVDIRNPDEQWTVQEFQKEAGSAIDDIRSRDHLPCIVGGTGFYIRALLKGYPLENAPPDQRFRRKMKELARAEGNRALHRLLLKRDSASWRDLHPNDVKRVIRALEYYETTGRPISARKSVHSEPPYDSVILGLQWERHELYERIDTRVEEQFRRGLIGEVEGLLQMGYDEDLPSMRGLCYNEACAYLLGLVTQEEAKRLLKRNTRRFAKRQFTWFAREEGIIWIPAGKDKLWENIVGQAVRLVEFSVHRPG